MAALAEVSDVQARWLDHELTAAETVAVIAWLDEVSAMIRLRVPGIDTRIAADPNLRAVAVGVAASAVLRVLRNPHGYVQETEGPFSARRADAVADGALHITPAELASLNPSLPFGTPTAYTVSLWG